MSGPTPSGAGQQRQQAAGRGQAPVTAVSEASAKRMPQCARPNGNCAMRRVSVPTHSRRNTALAHSAHTHSSGAPSGSSAKPTAAGGAVKMKAAGRSRSGHSRCNAMRLTTSPSTHRVAAVCGPGIGVAPGVQHGVEAAPAPAATPSRALTVLGKSAGGRPAPHASGTVWPPPCRSGSLAGRCC